MTKLRFSTKKPGLCCSKSDPRKHTCPRLSHSV